MQRDPSQTKVAVLMGGWSAERVVSLSTGEGCINALRQAGFGTIAVDVDRDIVSVLQDMQPDVVFNALHGKWGEDGTVQGILETLQIPYTHSGVLASALAMNKELSKHIFAAHNIPLADGKVVPIESAAAKHPLPTPYVIKPVAEGSSVGVRIVAEGTSQPPEDVLERRDIFGDTVLVERFIPGRELTCAVMGDVALGVIDIVPLKGFYDYTAKYAPGGSEHILPADIPNEIYRNVQKYALAAHRVLGCAGVTRADFRYNDLPGGENELVLLEINTQPGMTGTSLVPEIAAHAGHSFPELVTWMVNDASCNR